MSNLPENTQYNTEGTQNDIADFSGLIKNIQDSTSKNVSAAITKGFNKNVAANILTPAESRYVPKKEGLYEAGKQIVTPTKKTEEIPSYMSFVDADTKNRWVSPTESTLLKNLPATIGGGQYITDPSQPGSLIKAQRVLVNEDIRNDILGKRPSSMFEVDHLVPLWLGGADTITNLQVLDKNTHAKKTAAQAVPLTLLANDKINLNQAKQMALTWQNKDVSGIPEVDQYGYIPLDIAEKYQKKWEEDSKKIDTSKYFNKETITESMQDFGKGFLPTSVREFAKGLVGGASAGIVPGTEINEESGKIGTVSNIAGNILGTITGLGLLSKGVGLTFKGARSVMGMKKAVTVADEALIESGLVSDIGSLTAKSLQSAKRTETLKRVASSAGLLSLWGQIGTTGREITGQEQAQFKSHIKQFFTDVAYGGLLGSAGQNLKGYALVGNGTLALSLMTSGDVVKSLQDAALMTALHGIGYKKGLVDKTTRVGHEEAYKMSASTLNTYVGDIVPTVKKGTTVPETLKIAPEKVAKLKAEYKAKYPQDTRFDNLDPSDSGAAVQLIGKDARNKFMDTVVKADGKISPEEVKQELQRITVAENQLYNQTLPKEQRIEKEVQDLISLGEKLRPKVSSDKRREAANTTKLLNEVPFEMPEKVYENPNNTQFISGNVPTTGYGSNIDTISKQTINDFYNNPNNYSKKVFIVKDPEVSQLMRVIEQEQIAKGMTPDVGRPEDALRVFIKTKSGEVKPVGYMPREKSFDTKQNNLNKTYHEITNRLRYKIENAQSAESLKTSLNKDKSKISIDDKTAQSLYERKGKLESMSDEELYSILKPQNAFEKYSSDLNNSAISSEMDKHGIKVLVTDVNKILPVGGEAPRANPDNPYLALNLNEQDWLRSIELKNKISSPIQKGIQNIVSKQETNRYIDTSEKILKKTKTPKTQYTNEVYDEIVAKMDYTKPNIASAKKDEEYLVSLINNFKTKNPGLPEKDYQEAIQEAKHRAKLYAQETVDQRWLGTDIFGTDIKYERKQKEEPKNVLIKRYQQLANKSKGIKNISTGEDVGTGVILKTSEKEELASLKTKIQQHMDLDTQIKKIKEKAKSENRQLTTDEKTKIEDMSEERFGLTTSYRNPNKEAALILANKFGLEVTKPNESGFQYLKFDSKGNPMFNKKYSELYKGKTPNDVFGSFLNDEIKVYKNNQSRIVKEWASGIEKMKESKDPYAKAFATAFDTAMGEKYNVIGRDGNVLFNWKSNWKANSAISKTSKILFEQTNLEGYSRSEPFIAIEARTIGGKWPFIKEKVAEANKITKTKTEQAEMSRLDRILSSGSKDFSSQDVNVLSSQKISPEDIVNLRQKDPNQVFDVLEDVTPFDIMMNGLTKREVRSKLISQYNTLRSEMDSSSTGFKPDVIEEMKKIFNRIKQLSSDLPESKNWKLGSKIKLTNDGLPTAEDGIKDAMNVVSKIFQTKKSPRYVKYENVRSKVLESLKKPVK